MTNWNQTRLTFEFDSVEVNGQTMTLGILYNDQWIRQPELMPAGPCTQSYDIELPAKISLVAGNRDANSTLVDDNNCIIKNMVIAVKSIQLDGLKVFEPWLENALVTQCDDSDELILGSTICANGTVDIYFNESTAFHFVVKTRI